MMRNHDENGAGGGAAGGGMGQPRLSALDAAAVDYLLEGSERAAVSGPPDGDQARRVARVKAWLDVVGLATVPPPPADLVGRTLEAVRAERMRVGAASVEPEPVRIPRRHFLMNKTVGEMAAMATAAALLLVILIPGINRARQSAQRTACANNLRELGGAFGAYAAASASALPAEPLPADRNWLPVAETPGVTRSADAHSNTANLLPLVRGQYATLGRLVCPGLDQETPPADVAAVREVPDTVRGYSYANMYVANAPKWDGRSVVLADRNPLYNTAGESTRDPTSNSFNHGRTGNNMLVADGSVQWANRPEFGPQSDNVWTTRGGPVSYTGFEVPASAEDIFLAP